MRFGMRSLHDSNLVDEKRLAVCGVGWILAHFDRRRVEERGRVIGGAVGEDLEVDPIAAEDFDDDGRANLARKRIRRSTV